MGFLAGSAKHHVKYCPTCHKPSWQGTGYPYFRCGHAKYEEVEPKGFTTMTILPQPKWKPALKWYKNAAHCGLFEIKVSKAEGGGYHWEEPHNAWSDNENHKTILLAKKAAEIWLKRQVRHMYEALEIGKVRLKPVDNQEACIDCVPGGQKCIKHQLWNGAKP
jgi:hypothetical protein